MCLPVSLVVNGQTTCTSCLFLRFFLATHDVVRIVCQNPCFSKIWCRVSSISGPSKPFFYYFASASVSLLDSLCPTAGDIDGLHSQFGPYDQILRRSLDRVPLLCSWIPPLHIGCGINTSNSIRQKLFEAPWPAIQCKTTVLSVHPYTDHTTYSSKALLTLSTMLAAM